jgi:hypothetical protein
MLQGLIFLNLVKICPRQVSKNWERVAAVDHYRRFKVALQQDHGPAQVRKATLDSLRSPSKRCRAVLPAQTKAVTRASVQPESGISAENYFPICQGAQKGA